jgi:hypothetical protein
MATLRQFLIEQGATPCTINEGETKAHVLLLPLNKGSHDRFQTSVMYDPAFPNVLWVIKLLSRGLTIVPHSELLNNHNNLHPVAKEVYEKLLVKLTDNHVSYETQEARYEL